MAKVWTGFDLDGTLAVYTTWRGLEHIGEPIPPMIDKVKQLLRIGVTVKIFTERVASTLKPEEIERARSAIEKWCELHIGTVLPITAEKDLYMTECYDDRAVQVEYNTGKLLEDLWEPDE